MATFALRLHHREQVKENESKSEVTVFYDLILKVATHYFCYILLIWNKSWNPMNTLCEGVAQGCDTRRWESLRANSDAAYIEQRSILNSELACNGCSWKRRATSSIITEQERKEWVQIEVNCYHEWWQVAELDLMAFLKIVFHVEWGKVIC